MSDFDSYKGYSLHLDRLSSNQDRASQKIYRTHKYKLDLSEHDTQNLWEAFTTTGQVVDSSQKGSILWYLMKLYQLGFLIFSDPRTKELSTFKLASTGVISSEYFDIRENRIGYLKEQISKISDENKRKALEGKEEQLFDFLLTDGRNNFRSTLKNFLGLVGDSDYNDGELSYSDSDVLSFEQTEHICKQFEKNNVKDFRGRQKVVNDIFGIDVSLNKSSDSSTYIIIENKNEVSQIRNEELEDGEAQRTVLYLKSLVNQGKLPEMDTVMGTENNQSGLSNLLGEQFESWCAADYETIYNSIKQNAFISEERLQEIAQKMSELFSLTDENGEYMLNSSNNFLAKGWGEYRNYIGGALQGWTSNFFNRLEDFQSAFKDRIFEDEYEELFRNTPQAIRERVFVRDINGSYILSSKYNEISPKAGYTYEEALETLEPDEKSNFNLYFQEEKKKDGKVVYKLRSGEDIANKIKILEKSNTAIVSSIENSILAFVRSAQERNELQRAIATIKELNPRLLRSVHEQEFDSNFAIHLSQYQNAVSYINEYLTAAQESGVPQKGKYIFADEDRKDSLANKIISREQGVITLYDEGEQRECVKYKDNIFLNPNLQTDRKKRQEFEEGTLYLKSEYTLTEPPKYPKFIGQAQQNAEYRLENSWNQLLNFAREGQSFVNYVVHSEEFTTELPVQWHDWESNQDSELRKQLNSLLNIARNNDLAYWDIFINFFQECVTDSEKAKITQENLRQNNIPFFCSRYKRNQHEVLDGVLAITYEDFVRKVENYFGLSLDISDFVQFFSLSEDGASSNSILKGELLKFYWALRLKPLNENISLPHNFDEQFKQGVNTKGGRFFNNTLQPQTVQRIIQSVYGAEIRGNLSLLSRNSFIERQTLQITNGAQSALRYVPLEFSDISGEEERLRVYQKYERYIQDLCNSEEQNTYSEQWQSIFRELNQIIDKKSTLRDKAISYKKEHNISRKEIRETKYNKGRVALSLERYQVVKEYLDLYQEYYSQLQALRSVMKEYKVENVLRRQELSVQAQRKLNEAGITFERRTNSDIVRDIWHKFDKTDSKQLGKVLREIPHRWEMILKTDLGYPSSEILQEEKGLFILNSSQEKVTFNVQRSSNKSTKILSFPITMKGHQKQFFDKFLLQSSYDANQMPYQVKLSGTSIILEAPQRIQWNVNNGVPTFYQSQQKDFYWALPWEFTYKNSIKHSLSKLKTKKYSNLFSDEKWSYKYNEQNKEYQEYPVSFNRYLGIDIGEYGFGWSVLTHRESDNDALAELGKELQLKYPSINIRRISNQEGGTYTVISGFSRVSLLAHLRSEVDAWKKKQVSGTFSSPSSKLERIREQVVGEMRNQIHGLTQYFEAQPIYEDEVDAFEAGGQRIKKIYKSLKTSDVFTEGTQADSSIRQHIWGTTKMVGQVTGASLTSQMCRKCGRASTQTINELSEEYLRSAITGNTLPTEDGSEIGLPDTIDLSQKNLRKELYARLKEAQRIQSELERRGTQDVFQCQFTDCDNEIDADEQAALNIALKAFFKNMAYVFPDSYGKYYENDVLSTKSLFIDLSPKYIFME